MQSSRIVLLIVTAVSVAACSKKSGSESVSKTQTTETQPTKAPHKFVVELDPVTQVRPNPDDHVSAVETFTTANKLYAILEADSADVLGSYLQKANVTAKKIIEVRDINSPVRGGGKAAGPEPRTRQKTFVIERNIPGVGTFPDAKKEAISKKSNAAITQIGDASIEWVHSYLTDEGTYCVYRAADEGTIRKHGEITGAPITNVSEASAVTAAR